MKKLLLVALVLLFVGTPLAVLGVLFLAFDDRPLIAGGPEFTPAHIERAVSLLKKHDPRKAREGQLRTIQLSSAEVDLIANYAATRFGHGGAQVLLQPGAATVRAALAMPHNPFGGYINIDAALIETSGLPRVERLFIGRLPVPAWLAGRLLEYGAKRLSEYEGERVAADTIRSVSVADGTLRVVYEWHDDLPDRIRAVTLSQQDRERLRAYHDRIASVAERLRSGASLAELIRPVMSLAAERSASGDAYAENRAAIVALAFYANGKGVSALLPEARSWPRATPRALVLRGRGDLTQHFTISAALAATAGTPLSDAVGLYKEISDSRGGSGFSFTDLAADRAGTTFGQFAMRSADSARLLQSRAGTRLREADFMPDISALEDNLQEGEFKRRYGGVGGPAYNRVAQDIERRVAACTLYQ